MKKTRSAEKRGKSQHNNGVIKGGRKTKDCMKIIFVVTFTYFEAFLKALGGWQVKAAKSGTYWLAF